MSFSDPVRIIDHIPKDFNMKVRNHRKARPIAKPASTAPATAPAEAPTTPPCEKPSTVWKAIAFLGALAIILGALVTGAWNENPN